MSETLDKLKAAIGASGESRRQIALRANVNEAALCRLMSGERGLSIDAAERLAAALGLKIVVMPAGQKAGAKKDR